jgi:hypothetical protein
MFSYAGYFPVCSLSPIVVYSLETGAPLPIDEFMLVLEASDEGHFYAARVTA